ncbi:MAG: ribose transport system substrate-binding protein [Mariniblastus sp.]|jgi:ribose transport system substrate-binding protein
MTQRRSLAVATAFLITFAYCLNPAGTASAAPIQDKPTIAFVTNQIANFWNIAEVGAKDAGEDFKVDVDVRFPSEATATKQKQIIEDLLSSGIDGLAISPIDAINQRDMLNDWATKIPLITHDSDAPDTNRLLYIGVDNYAAGRTVGKLIKDSYPNGANVILAIGRLEQDNAKKRQQGVIDELLDRKGEFEWRDEVGEVEGEKFTILTTLVDQGAAQVAKQKAEDALNTYPEVELMVGLFEYNPPAMLQAIKQANKLDKVKVAGFDENDITLQGIKDGTVIGTVVQNPYEYGYQSVRVLSELIKGNKSVIPKSKYIDVPARAVTKDGRKIGGKKTENVDEFWADLKEKVGN